MKMKCERKVQKVLVRLHLFALLWKRITTVAGPGDRRWDYAHIDPKLMAGEKICAKVFKRRQNLKPGAVPIHRRQTQRRRGGEGVSMVAALMQA